MSTAKVTPAESLPQTHVSISGAPLERRLSRREVQGEVTKAMEAIALQHENKTRENALNEKRKSLTLLAPFARFSFSGPKSDAPTPLGFPDPISQRKSDEMEIKKKPSYIETLRQGPYGSIKVKLYKFVVHRVFQVIVLIATFVALFGMDIAVAALEPSVYPAVEGVLLVCLIIFLTELVLNMIVKPDYINTFYFWMDVVGSLSLIPDIGLIMNLFEGDEEENDTDSFAILRAGKLIRTGTRTTKALRILRVIRFARVLRMFRLIKVFRLYITNRQLRHISKEETQPSKLGLQLADLLGKRNVIALIVLLLSLPQLEVAVIDYSTTQGLQILEILANSTLKGHIPEKVQDVNASQISDIFSEEFIASKDRFLSMNPQIQQLCISNYLVKNIEDESILDDNFQRHLTGGGITSSDSKVYSWTIFSIYEEAKMQAIYNIILTCILIVGLGSLGYLFNRDVQNAVVTPIVRTTKAIRKLARTLFLLSHDEHQELDDLQTLEGDFVESVVDKLTVFFAVDQKKKGEVQQTQESQKESKLKRDNTAPVIVQKPLSPRDMISSERVKCLRSLEDIWSDPQGLQFFKVFLTSEFAVESLLFVQKIDYFKVMFQEIGEVYEDLILHFICERADRQVNISDKQREAIMMTSRTTMQPETFDVARTEIFKQLERDNFPRFKKSGLAAELVALKKKQLKEYSLLKAEDELLNKPVNANVVGLVKLFSQKLMAKAAKEGQLSTIPDDPETPRSARSTGSKGSKGSKRK